MKSKAKTPKEPVGNKKKEKTPVTRYQMMAILVDQKPLAADEFAKIVAQHRKFIASGGGGGCWHTFVTEGDAETGVVLGVYVGQENDEATGVQAELSHKRLDGLDLRGVELPFADLCGVSCRGQDLRGANLSGSLITDADFAGSNFQKADLSGADFSRTDLTGCDFRKANLSGTDFENADLSGADLRGANVKGTRFPGAKMDETRQ
jgi:Pentapeptide repeats (8 copies)